MVFSYTVFVYGDHGKAALARVLSSREGCTDSYQGCFLHVCPCPKRSRSKASSSRFCLRRLHRKLSASDTRRPHVPQVVFLWRLQYIAPEPIDIIHMCPRLLVSGPLPHTGPRVLRMVRITAGIPYKVYRDSPHIHAYIHTCLPPWPPPDLVRSLTAAAEVRDPDSRGVRGTGSLSWLTLITGRSAFSFAAPAASVTIGAPNVITCVRVPLSLFGVNL